MNTAEFDYDLPVEYIAQTPVEPRDSARLLVMDRQSGMTQHAIFRDLPQFLNPGDILVLNQTRVIRARLFARKLPGMGKVEMLLLRHMEANYWEVLVGGKGLTPGKRLQIDYGPQARIASDLGGPRRLVEFDEDIESCLSKAGNVPLPPYIKSALQDPERYQTVYARIPGSAAAPTAGLHFTSRLIDQLVIQGIQLVYVTLHVGLDTFMPVNQSRAEDHKIHSEWCEITQGAAEIINQAKARGNRIIAVGTTTVRTLESASLRAAGGENVKEFSGFTDLFILPGYQFKVVDGMITNFHLPCSTLIMLVSAFAGRENVLAAYAEAIRSGYRFYSFGDAMLIN